MNPRPSQPDQGGVAIIRVCGWCQRFLGVKEPLRAWAVTHGICEPCLGHFTSTAPRESPAQRPAAVLVLSRDIPPVAGHLGLPTRAYLEPTIVVWDRRYGQRRRSTEPSGIERRRFDRRMTAAVLWTRGLLMLPPRWTLPSGGETGAAA